MKNIIFCDIDGTILDGSRSMNYVSDKTRYAINELKKDNYVFIASGRCKGLLDRHIIELNPSGYILCNGAYAEVSGKPIHTLYFEDEVIEKLKEIVFKYEGFYILETLDEMFIDSYENKALKLFMNEWGMALSGFKENKNPKGKYHICMVGFLEKDQLDMAFKELSEIADVAPHISYASGDINIKGVNKATGVKAIVDYLNIPIENTYCFGDGINDLEMLQCVGHPVIMENCDPKLKNLGFEQTDDVLNDGLYNYLVSNKLIKAL